MVLVFEKDPLIVNASYFSQTALSMAATKMRMCVTSLHNVQTYILSEFETQKEFRAARMSLRLDTGMKHVFSQSTGQMMLSVSSDART